MKLVEMELYTAQTNYAVVRLPERRYPGVVVQGDSLASLVSDLSKTLARASKTGDEELTEILEDLLIRFDEVKRDYELALKSHHISLPYGAG